MDYDHLMATKPSSRHWYTVSYDKAQRMHKQGFTVRQHKKGYWQVLCYYQEL